MNTAIRSTEGKRGCGYRKEGGLYLMGDKPSASCGRLPIEMTVCPACAHGVKPSRGWTWINPLALFGAGNCENGYCGGCPVGGSVPERAGLLWIGSQHYKTPSAFLAEAQEVGISRRLSAMPKGMEAGKTVVYLAHRQAIVTPCICVAVETGADGQDGCTICKGRGWTGKPGIFSAFKPSHWEKVVGEDTPEEDCEKLRKRGIQPVIVTESESDQEA